MPSLYVRRNAPSTRDVVRGRSLNGSDASMEASSITHAPTCGDACRPARRRTVWWLGAAGVRTSLLVRGTAVLIITRARVCRVIAVVMRTEDGRAPGQPA